jgi:hypothetical protein
LKLNLKSPYFASVRRKNTALISHTIAVAPPKDTSMKKEKKVFKRIKKFVDEPVHEYNPLIDSSLKALSQPKKY